jgi:hypothetical protein
MSDEPGIDLFERFPDMRPVKKPPTLQTHHLIGTWFYGRRDHDAETGTYVGTQYFVIFLIPIFALGAYRVLPAQGGGWYFLGRVPLSRNARTYNYAVGLSLLLLACVLGFHLYTDTAEYKAGQKIAEADRLAAAGEEGRAAGVYREVMAGRTGHAPAARQKLQGLLESPPAQAAQAAQVFRVALELHRQNDKLVPDLFATGVNVANHAGQDDPRGALEVIEVVAPLAARPQDHLGPRRALLEKLAQRQPGDVDLVSRLAAVYEALGESARCEALLAPHEKDLGTREGAAILGRIRLAQGKYDSAMALLAPFVEGRLQALQRAEQNHLAVWQARNNAVFAELQARRAPGFDYKLYDAAGPANRNLMVQNYMAARLRDDPQLRAAAAERSALAGVEGAAMDLGLVRLRRAQGLANPAERKAELEAAEKTFLSVKELSGQSAGASLFLGQVYYWLGRSAEGKKVHDKLLADSKRSTEMLIAVAKALREVGAISEARKITEEAYGKEADRQKKYRAAHLRSLLSTDMDDQIAWLEKGDPDDKQIQANRAQTRGYKALLDNKPQAAASEYRRAIELYAGMPENSTTLNNCAMVWLALYSATHDREDLTRGLDRMERALALRPSDSILLQNAFHGVLENALLDVAGAMDLKTLDRPASLDLLGYLHDDRAGRARLAGQVRAHPGVVKARAHLERLLVVAPAWPVSYRELAQLCRLLGDEEGLRSVQERLAKVELDLTQYEREWRDYYAGKQDAKKAEERKKVLARQESVLEAARKKGGVTRAVAAASLAQARLVAGGRAETRPSDVVILAEEAHQAAPSSSTRLTLANALIYRAHQALKKDDPAYALLAKRLDRSLGQLLVGYVLGGPEGEQRDRVAANADVKRATRLYAEELEKEPDRVVLRSWPFLRVLEPAAAEKLAKLAQADRAGERKRAIDRTLTPLAVGSILNAYWSLRLAGKDAEAEGVLRQAAKRGVPMPVGS